MRKSLLCIIATIAIPLLANARSGEGDFVSRLQFGIEWGYSQNLFKYQHYNIVSNEGYRIDEKTEGFNFYPNGMLLANIGYDLSKRLNIALYAGYAGLNKDSRVFPVSLRLSVFPGKTMEEDGFYTFIEGGTGLRIKNMERQDAAMFACVGEAYRIKLTPYFNLDFIMSLRAVFDKPLINNPDGPGYIEKHNIRRNSARYYALNFSVALNF